MLPIQSDAPWVQVVKRARSALDSSFLDLHSATGNKRSVHERLGNVADSSFQVNNKRLRGDGRSASSVSGYQPEILSSSLWFVLQIVNNCEFS